MDFILKVQTSIYTKIFYVSYNSLTKGFSDIVKNKDDLYVFHRERK